ncbi:MAG: DUF3179 domain-containing (seleno)protein [Opitutales bacterium]
MMRSPKSLFRLDQRCSVLLGLLLTSTLIAGPVKNGFDLSDASVPADEVMSGGPGRDGIPAIDEPRFIDPGDADFLKPDDKVIHVSLKGEHRAYPVRILDWHEVVNDTIAGEPVAVTYCPLCRTAMVFHREIDGEVTSFGVSGLLYNSDVLLYDRASESLWSQLKTEAVSGPHKGKKLEWLPSTVMTWEGWRERFPKGRVLSKKTGYSRPYWRDNYRDYHDSPNLMFPVNGVREIPGLKPKSLVVGTVIDGQPAAFKVDDLPKGQPIQTRVGGTPVLILRDADSDAVTFTRPETGEWLPGTPAYWFAWSAFYPESEIWTAALAEKASEASGKGAGPG